MTAVLTRCVVVILLFSSWPLLNFTFDNRQALDGSGLSFISLMFVCVLVSGYVAFYLLYRLTRRSRPIAVAVTISLAVLLFFNYYLLYDGIVYVFSILGFSKGENYAYLLIAALTCLASICFLNRKPILDFLLVFGLVATAVPAIGSAYFFLSVNTAAIRQEAQETSSNAPYSPFLSSPNIFHIILDAYAREDLLRSKTDWDNSEFVDSLKQRGFYIASRSYSNYPTTVLSIASTMEMNYPVTDDSAPYRSKVKYIKSIQGENQVVSHLKRHQYRYAHFGSGKGVSAECSGMEDLCLSSSNAMQQAILYLTPLRRFVISRRTNISEIDRRLDKVMEPGRPTFFFAHVLVPHPPRTFSASCSQLNLKGSAPITDYWGDHAGYTNDIKCVNQQVLGLIDKILERDSKAVIILHADHGTAFSVDWSLPIDKWPGSQSEERFAILMALRFPVQCSEHLYDNVSPVNIYPLLFACLQGDEPELLPDISYISPKDDHPQYGIAFPYQASSDRAAGNNRSD
jgi:hypothetical protein